MNITCERPYVFFALLLIIPVFIIARIRNRQSDYYNENSFNLHKKNSKAKRLFNFRKMVFIRSLFISLSACMLIFAYAKISWGTHFMPVQKNGTSVSFVFDISNSMLAKDGPEGSTRLQAASLYAEKLLSKMDGNPVSVVLAKGDGVTAVPLTEDYTMIESLLEVISPALMTVPGSSIGKGILKAKESFPSNYSTAGRIWVFTDGEETDSQLKNALTECITSGIPVTIIGFGAEAESQVLAGDGKTYVSSALRTEKIQKTIEDVKKNLSYYKNQTPITFINSTERGSGMKLLSQLNDNQNQVITYEAKPVPRYKFFLLLAVLFFAFSYIFTEFDFSKLFSDSKKLANVVLVFGIFGSLFLSGCSSQTASILKGTYAFRQKQYKHAVSCYLTAVQNADENNPDAYYYSLFDLGTAYSMLDENEAAMEKFAKVSEDAPAAVLYAVYYNSGVIAHKNGEYDKALDYFRQALEVDSTRIEAKINMELSIQLAEENVQHNEKKSLPSSEQKSPVPEMEKSVFDRVKENDKKQWKNSESDKVQNLADDY